MVWPITAPNLTLMKRASQSSLRLSVWKAKAELCGVCGQRFTDCPAAIRLVYGCANAQCGKRDGSTWAGAEESHASIPDWLSLRARVSGSRSGADRCETSKENPKFR